MLMLGGERSELGMGFLGYREVRGQKSEVEGPAVLALCELGDSL